MADNVAEPVQYGFSKGRGLDALSLQVVLRTHSGLCEAYSSSQQFGNSLAY